jgi:hypothetical protein
MLLDKVSIKMYIKDSYLLREILHSIYRLSIVHQMKQMNSFGEKKTLIFRISIHLVHFSSFGGNKVFRSVHLD